MSSLSDLPTELTTGILTTAISQHPNPSCILAVNRHFNDIGQFIIYASLRFKSESQLVKFALKRRFHAYNHTHTHHTHHRHKDEDQEGFGTPAVAITAACSGGAGTIYHSGTSDIAVKRLLPYSPRSISVRIPGGQGSSIIFEAIKHVFELCAEAAGTGVLALDSLEFCLHSRTSDPSPWRIGEALSLVNPCRFVWTGPDPPHHFSIAIVPCATYHLFQSIKAWSNLQSLTLTNISFPSRRAFIPVSSSGPDLVVCALANSDDGPLIPLEMLSNLRSIYIGQATLVPTRSIVRLALAKPETKLLMRSGSVEDGWYHEREVEGKNGGLREIRLVDAYKESIWQERIRRKDLEAVAMEVAFSDTDSWYHSFTGEIDSEAVLGRIRGIVSCEVLTERIVGGDRAEGMTTLI